MFTGIIEEIGTIQTILKGQQSSSLIINANKVLENVQLGDSIAVNGVCLTVTHFSAQSFHIDVMAETIRTTNLELLKPKDQVNLERALQLKSRLGGHIVSGHIDGTGKISAMEKEDNAIWLSISASKEILKYIIKRGSIAIDGVSLTVAEVGDSEFKVSIIPHTKEMTTLIQKGIGVVVNLECDVIGKYIEKLMTESDTVSSSQINTQFLKDNGFI